MGILGAPTERRATDISPASNGCNEWSIHSAKHSRMSYSSKSSRNPIRNAIASGRKCCVSRRPCPVTAVVTES